MSSRPLAAAVAEALPTPAQVRDLRVLRVMRVLRLIKLVMLLRASRLFQRCARAHMCV